MQEKALLTLLVAALLFACGTPPSARPPESTKPRVWFDAPLPGTVLSLPDPCQVVAHGASTHGLSVFELSINGREAASIPSPDVRGPLVTLTRDCDLSAAGDYLLQLRVRDNAGAWSAVAETLLTLQAEAPPGQVPRAANPTGAPTAPLGVGR